MKKKGKLKKILTITFSVLGVVVILSGGFLGAVTIFMNNRSSNVDKTIKIENDTGLVQQKRQGLV